MAEKKVLYIEGTSGISGDMFVGALIDLGADLEVLARTFDSIPAEGFAVDVGRVKKNGIDCVDFDVILDEDNHDHDMAYLYGPAAAESVQNAVCCDHHHGEEGEACGCGHHHGEESGCCGLHHHDEESGCCSLHHHEEGETCGCGCHDEEEGGCCGLHHHEDGETCGGGHHYGEEGGCCGHHHHGEEGCCGHHHHHEEGHHHEHRHLADVEAIIDGTDMTDHARAIAKRIFRIVAEAESKAHRLPLEEVHFHEVGAVDSIVDIIAAAVCFDNLGITDVIIPHLCEGTGTVRCQHGVLPVPVPAVAHIAEDYGLDLQIMDVRGEFVTPTGAAIAAALRTSDRLPARFRVEKTGLGAGKRAYTERPPFLRAMLIRSEEEAPKDEAMLLQTDIDDSTGEALGYVMEQLMAAGAKDVHYSPVYMKKNRPAWELSVLCAPEETAAMEAIIFRETTTIGIRELPVRRAVLPRRELTVATPCGEAQVKCCTIGDTVRYYPEYESVKTLAQAAGRPFSEVWQMVRSAAEAAETK